MIRVLIVEDDPMVAQLNKQFLAKIEGYTLVAMANSVAEARERLTTEVIDLVLLDVYMPEEDGLALLSDIRAQQLPTDAILITAATDVTQVQTALRYGAVDYLIKPFEFERFKTALNKYKQHYDLLQGQQSISQTSLDRQLLSQTQTPDNAQANLPKGLTQKTLQAIINKVNDSGERAFSTDEIAEMANISRVSVRKYLKFLADIEVLEESMTYGIGRPVYLYTFNKENMYIVQQYLQ
ncbi:response regulator [Staphylococcus arlettae]|uniref:response regulator n=1 Tax=Staphylococcus TaxID=1279 RepID=UPI00039112AF|nr:MULTISPECIES: response regulator [Staphylococcus]ERF48682.1 transcriptional regulator [Staphylococcus sp. EGD-HP3]MCD8841082.1 response regulator [Staphylococcus arlettae]MCP8714570.1 response regulator [Staphylococcus arlettae]MDN0188978.1 response regulator [Staphylococcus arlettae]